MRVNILLTPRGRRGFEPHLFCEAHYHYAKLPYDKVRKLGFEPRNQPWKGRMIPLSSYPHLKDETPCSILKFMNRCIQILGVGIAPTFLH